jgi:hypothetical protein
LLEILGHQEDNGTEQKVPTTGKQQKISFTL